jgi:hypothetical protein
MGALGVFSSADPRDLMALTGGLGIMHIDSDLNKEWQRLELLFAHLGSEAYLMLSRYYNIMTAVANAMSNGKAVNWRTAGRNASRLVAK